MHCILKITIALVHYSNKFHPVYREFGFAMVLLQTYSLLMDLRLIQPKFSKY